MYKNSNNSFYEYCSFLGENFYSDNDNENDGILCENNYINENNVLGENNKNTNTEDQIFRIENNNWELWNSIFLNAFVNNLDKNPSENIEPSYFMKNTEITESITNEKVSKKELQSIYTNSKNDMEKKNNNKKRKREETTSTPKTENIRPDNMIRKCKHIYLDNLINFINEKIKELYNNNIGRGICEKQFKKLNQTNKSSTQVKHTQDYLNKTIKEILSEDISQNPHDFNRNLVNKLLNDEDIEKSTYFMKLFDLTFLQTLNQFRGTEFCTELSGMNSLDQELKKYEDDDYRNNLKFYLENFEIIVKKRRSRKSKHSESN